MRGAARISWMDSVLFSWTVCFCILLSWSQPSDELQQSDRFKIQSDDVPIGSGTLAGDLGGITILNPWSNKSNSNLEDSACTGRILFFFQIAKQSFKKLWTIRNFVIEVNTAWTSNFCLKSEFNFQWKSLPELFCWTRSKCRMIPRNPEERRHSNRTSKIRISPTYLYSKEWFMKEGRHFSDWPGIIFGDFLSIQFLSSSF